MPLKEPRKMRESFTTSQFLGVVSLSFLFPGRMSSQGTSTCDVKRWQHVSLEFVTDRELLKSNQLHLILGKGLPSSQH
jgi:hypothetical protein